MEREKYDFLVFSFPPICCMHVCWTKNRGIVSRTDMIVPFVESYVTFFKYIEVSNALFVLRAPSDIASPFLYPQRPFRQLTGLRVLHELDLDDADDVRDTTLYKLSLSPGLERFR